MAKITKQPLSERLLQAGLEELSLHGFENFSVRRIAASCGVSCAAPYKHFADKQAFIAAIFAHINNLWLTHEAEILVAAGTPREKLLRICVGYVRFLVENPNFRTILTMAAKDFDASFRIERAQLTSNTELLVAQCCEELQITPEAKKRKLYVARSLIYGAAFLFDNGELELSEENLEMVRACIDREFDLP